MFDLPEKVNLFHPYISMHFPHCSLDISQVTDKENLFNNQEIL